MGRDRRVGEGSGRSHDSCNCATFTALPRHCGFTHGFIAFRFCHVIIYYSIIDQFDPTGGHPAGIAECRCGRGRGTSQRGEMATLEISSVANRIAFSSPGG